MKRSEWFSLLEKCLEFHDQWQSNWPAFVTDPSVQVRSEQITTALDALFERLRESYPFFHPNYVGQMLKPPHPVAVLAYFTTMLINPNNHALDGGPATSYLEREAVAQIAQMLGYTDHLGHLTSGGTVANFEALWITRQIHPDRWVVFSEHAHYTIRRACEILNLPFAVVSVDPQGRMDLDHLEVLLRRHPIGTVVVTVGTTGLGAVDPLEEILYLQPRYGFRIHADAAYGGFFKLLAERVPPEVHPVPFQSLPMCDSIVVDPHKHGLQPYGCGCIVYRDPGVAQYYHHESPYTYYTARELHLGEVSFECSRPGAAAAALWTTLRCLPLHPYAGLGNILSRTRTAALAAYRFLEESEWLAPVVEPALDIIAFFPRRAQSASAVTALTDWLFDQAMHHMRPPIYLSKLKLPTSWLQRRFPNLVADTPETTVLRSVLMKPEHADTVRSILQRLEDRMRSHEAAE